MARWVLLGQEHVGAGGRGRVQEQGHGVVGDLAVRQIPVLWVGLGPLELDHLVAGVVVAACGQEQRVGLVPF